MKFLKTIMMHLWKGATNTGYLSVNVEYCRLIRNPLMKSILPGNESSHPYCVALVAKFAAGI